MESILYYTLSGKRDKQNWVARVAGTDPEFDVERKFLYPVKSGGYEYALKLDILYEICDRGKRRFLFVCRCPDTQDLRLARIDTARVARWAQYLQLGFNDVAARTKSE